MKNFFLRVPEFLKNAPLALPREVISIDIGSGSLKAVVVRRKGKKITLVSAMQTSTEIDAGYDINRIGRFLGGLLQKAGAYPKQAVVVTDRVKFLASELNISPEKKLPEDRLLAAVVWEMEPFLDFPPQQGLFGCRVQKASGKKETTPVMISAMDKRDFSDLAEILKDFQLSLYRAYSPEGASAFASPDKTRGKDRIFLNFRGNALIGVLMRSDGEPLSIQSLPAGESDIFQSDRIKKMIQELTVFAGETEEIVIAGDGANEQQVRAMKRELSMDIRLWSPEDDLGGFEITLEVGEVGPQHAAALGAALQQLRLVENPLGVTDRVALVKRVRENIHFVPATAVALVFFTFLAHYTFMKTRINHYTKEIKALQEEKGKLTRLRDERISLESKEKDASRKKKYLLQTLPAQKLNLISLFIGICEAIPEEVVLEKLSQEDKNTFCLKGGSLSGNSIAAFVDGLSKLTPCKEVKLKNMQRTPEEKEARSLPFNFLIQLTLKEA
jgi:Tfp pilus assembly protein PilN